MIPIVQWVKFLRRWRGKPPFLKGGSTKTAKARIGRGDLKLSEQQDDIMKKNIYRYFPKTIDYAPNQ